MSLQICYYELNCILVKPGYIFLLATATKKKWEVSHDDWTKSNRDTPRCHEMSWCETACTETKTENKTYMLKSFFL